MQEYNVDKILRELAFNENQIAYAKPLKKVRIKNPLAKK